MENLYGMTLTRLREICRDEALPAFAAGQIVRWLYVRRVQRVDAMTDLSRAAREKLARRFEARLTPPLRTSVSADGTLALTRLLDGTLWTDNSPLKVAG